MPSEQEMHLYEYAVIRYIPRVEREEFVNVGLVMMCKRRRWIRVATDVDADRLRALSADSDADLLSRQLQSFSAVASGSGSRFGAMSVEERFRWLTAVRSACISTSRPHPGKTTDLEKTFAALMDELVL